MSVVLPYLACLLLRAIVVLNDGDASTALTIPARCHQVSSLFMPKDYWNSSRKPSEIGILRHQTVHFFTFTLNTKRSSRGRGRKLVPPDHVSKGASSARLLMIRPFTSQKRRHDPDRTSQVDASIQLQRRGPPAAGLSRNIDSDPLGCGYTHGSPSSPSRLTMTTKPTLDYAQQGSPSAAGKGCSLEGRCGAARRGLSSRRLSAAQGTESSGLPSGGTLGAPRHGRRV